MAMWVPIVAIVAVFVGYLIGHVVGYDQGFYDHERWTRRRENINQQVDAMLDAAVGHHDELAARRRDREGQR